MKHAAALKELLEEVSDIHLLYVEDDEQLRENTIRLLSTFFPTIDSAVNGQEGLDKYQAGQYEIVISDLRMPVMDGVEMVKRIKELNNEQLVVITSAHDESNYLMELIRAGVESFILKPLDVDQFLSVLLKAVRYIQLKRMEADYTRKLEETVEKRTQELSQANQQLEEYNVSLEDKVAQRTAELNSTLIEVEKANQRVMDSIEYAKMIQWSLLPNLDELKAHLPDCFVLWAPRDIVGGDIYQAHFVDGGFIIAVFDCTGHGVPGALMTMLASSGMRKILEEEKHRDPAVILKRLNMFIKTSLQQDTEFALSNDGLDAAICYVETEIRQLTFAGARLPLVCFCDEQMQVIPGDRHSIGYKDSDLNFKFTKSSFKIKEGALFYLFTDGFMDQIGGETQMGFGRKNFEVLLAANHQKTLQEQKHILQQTFSDFRGDTETRDDVTVLGFRI